MTNKNTKNKLRHINQEIRNKIEDFNNDITSTLKKSENLIDKIEFIHDINSLSNYPGLNFITIRDSLCRLNPNKTHEWVPNILATSGSGPWEESEFDEFLFKQGFNLYNAPSRDVNCLVLGILGWREEHLSEQIYKRNSSSLKIYTQELFVYGLIAGRDPFDILEQETIDEVGLNHPGIQYVLNKDFTWPWDEFRSAGETLESWGFENTDWADESVLKQMGYSVSLDGPNEIKRRNILKRAFESNFLDGTETHEKKERWGSGMSARRLYSISHLIAWFINFQGSKNSTAKEKWISDLKWLKDQFYDNSMQFKWPVTSENSSGVRHTYKSTLNPTAAWPYFVDNKLNNIENKVKKQNKTEESKKLMPRHALSLIIGDEPRSSVEDAVNALRFYLDRHRLYVNGSSLIEADHLIFSLAGTKHIEDRDLYQIVSKNLI